MKARATIQCRAKLSKGGLRRLDWVRSVLNRLYNMDRDHNAAINILRAGVSALGAGTWADGPSVAPELCTGRPDG